MQSPFIGVKESLESPILYQRYTDISQILQVAVIPANLELLTGRRPLYKNNAHPYRSLSLHSLRKIIRAWRPQETDHLLRS